MAKTERSPRKAPFSPTAVADRTTETRINRINATATPQSHVLSDWPASQGVNAVSDDINKSLLNEIRLCFDLAPNCYIAEGRRSPSTRSPAHYDRHLSEKLKLKKVLYSPDLAAQISSLAEDALVDLEISGRNERIHNPDTFVYRNIHISLESAESSVSSEGQLVERYKSSIFDNTGRIASALTSGSWNYKLFKWIATNTGQKDRKYRSEEPTAKTQKDNYAIPDAVLYVNVNPNATNVSPEFLEKLKKIKKHYEHILLYEFKSIHSGSYSVMLEIQRLSTLETFPWVGCEDPKQCGASCGPKIGRKTGPVTGDPLGWDAMEPVIRTSKCTWSAVVDCVDQENMTHAIWILQQAWAECVKYDSTFNVINAGNFEIICYRNREKQTFHLSNIIRCTESGYFKLHIGLYIAAFRDAADRASRLEKGEPATFNVAYDNGFGKVPPGKSAKPDFFHVIHNYPNLCVQKGRKDKSKSPHYYVGRCYKRVGAVDSATPDPENNLFLLRLDPTNEYKVYLGRLIVREHSYTNRVVVKTGLGVDGAAILSGEYQKLLLIQDKSQDCKVQGVYGLFICEVETNRKLDIFTILLLQYAGQRVESPRDLTERHKESLMRTLEVIHGSGMVIDDLDHLKISLLEKKRELAEQNGRAPNFLGATRSRRISAAKQAKKITGPPADCTSGRKRKADDDTDADVPYISGLLRLREAKDAEEKETEQMRFRSFLLQGKKTRQDISYVLCLGPFRGVKARTPETIFAQATNWMPRELVVDIRCSVGQKNATDFWLLVEFQAQSDMKSFVEHWETRTMHRDIVCWRNYSLPCSKVNKGVQREYSQESIGQSDSYRMQFQTYS